MGKTIRIGVLLSVACGLMPLYGQENPGVDSLGSSKGVYEPGPELSPSLEQLYFENMLPGESRTLFMDLANLGDGTIEIGLVQAPRAIQVGLTPQTLHPGQFVRFPVSFTQAGLDTHELELRIPWRAPRFNTEETLRLSVLSIPRTPLQVIRPEVHWYQVFTGFRYTQRISIRNRGYQAIFFPAEPVLLPDLEVSALPQVLAPGKTANLTFYWRPRKPDTLAAEVTLPFRIGDIAGREIITMDGLARRPVTAAPDTLHLGTVYAGSEYSARVLLRNHSQQEVTLRLDDSSPAGSDSMGTITLPRQVKLEPAGQAELPVRLLVHRPGSFRKPVRYLQQLTGRGLGADRSIPAITFTVAAEVELPLVVTVDSLRFPDQPVQETTLLSLQVVNRGRVPLELRPYLASGRATFTVPPLTLICRPEGSLAIPLYFRPMDMVDYRDTVVIAYAPAGIPQQAEVTVSGRGLDRPLLLISRLPDVTREEDFPGPVTVASLDEIFRDANHPVSYRYFHSFGSSVMFTVTEDRRLQVSTTPNYHGEGDVVVEALNALGQAVADTFHLAITAVNDLPVLVAPLPDLVIREDQPALIMSRLRDLFHDPDEALELVTTYFHIYNTAGDDKVRLEDRRGELVLSIEPNWYGSRSFVVTARDAADTSAAVFDLFKVTVVAVNDTPRVAPLPDLMLLEDQPRFIDWRAYLSDVDDPPENLTIKLTDEAGGALPLTFQQSGLGGTITPVKDWSGELRARLTVVDLSDAAAAGEFNLVVEPVDDPPGVFTLAGPVIYSWEKRLSFSGQDTLLTFEWHPSADRDPNDQISYTWQLLDATRRRIVQERPAGFATLMTAVFDSTGIYFWTVVAKDLDGQATAGDTLPVMVESLRSPVERVPGQLAFDIGPSYPNPFSEQTRIQYSVPRYSEVVITIFDAMGRKVRTLMSEFQYAGQYTVRWDGRDNQGSPVASGHYVAELRSDNQSAHLKLVLVH
ncbi:MAG: FlgD immunoglobulin-like domain containing protein [Candidatus Neomarinimicrobiota bacterium]